jgi:hypothetical protein
VQVFDYHERVKTSDGTGYVHKACNDVAVKPPGQDTNAIKGICSICAHKVLSQCLYQAPTLNHSFPVRFIEIFV